MHNQNVTLTLPTATAEALKLLIPDTDTVTVQLPRDRSFNIEGRSYCNKKVFLDEEGDIHIEGGYFDKAAATQLRDLITALLEADILRY